MSGFRGTLRHLRAAFVDRRPPESETDDEKKAATSRRTPRWPALLAGWASVAALAIAGRSTAAENAAAQPGVLLCDFETDEEIALWHDEGQARLGGQKTLARVPRLATAGRSAMEFRTPAWK